MQHAVGKLLDTKRGTRIFPHFKTCWQQMVLCVLLLEPAEKHESPQSCLETSCKQRLTGVSNFLLCFRQTASSDGSLHKQEHFHCTATCNESKTRGPRCSFKPQTTPLIHPLRKLSVTLIRILSNVNHKPKRKQGSFLSPYS